MEDDYNVDDCEALGVRYDNRINNGSTFANWMLGLIAAMVAIGVTGQIWFNNQLVERLSKDETIIGLIVEGRIQIPDQHGR
jgi:hypothetical protein